MVQEVLFALELYLNSLCGVNQIILQVCCHQWGKEMVSQVFAVQNFAE